MVRETLGDQIDIHGGGADLIFPHHENEIAQSESLTGKVPFAQHWAHAGLVVLGGGEKMAHSAENFTTLASILDEYAPVEVRFYLLATHYRSSLTFLIDSEDGSRPRVRGIEDARGALGRLRRALGEEPLNSAGPLDQPAVDAFTAAMDADFNTPDALAVIFELAREINRLRAAQDNIVGERDTPLTLRGDDNDLRSDIDRLRRTLVYLLDVLGVDLRSHAAEPPTIDPDVVELLLDQRRKARELRQWALADELRARLAVMGVRVEDTPHGTIWRADTSLPLKEAAERERPPEGEGSTT
jgi:cysteinyl-tRNA synthetase